MRVRRIILALISGILLMWPFATHASADPVRDEICKVSQKLGYDWFQDCSGN